jgi:hypothetical protein
MSGRRGSGWVWLAAAVILAGCYQSSGDGEGDATDARDTREGDGAHDVSAEDARPEAAMDVLPGCEPQEVGEDPYIDCDMCQPCDPTPVRWVGDRCTYQPICCRCAGADCGNTFATLDECLAAYATCPMASGEGPAFPGARLVWQAPGGFAGTGPVLAVDGDGFLRTWGSSGEIGLEDPSWSAADYDHSESIGYEGANALFRLLTAVDYSGLPHPPGPWSECYPLLIFRSCATCEPVRLDYGSAPDLLPEMQSVYDWLDRRLCPTEAFAARPSDLCLFEL